MSLFALSYKACEWRLLYVRTSSSTQVLLGYKGTFVQWQLNHGHGRSRCPVYILKEKGICFIEYTKALLAMPPYSCRESVGRIYIKCSLMVMILF